MNKKIEKRPYQQTAVTECVNTLKEHGRAQCHMAPGSGKTIITLLVKEQLKPKVTIFFVPTIQLIYQQYLSWAEHQSQKFDALVVSVGRISEQNKARLDILEQNHVGNTTDAWLISQFLLGSNDKVIFSTYKSAQVIIDACSDHAIDLAIFDEAHHVAGAFDKRSTRLLYEQNIKITNRLFVTATPRLNRDPEKALVYAGMENEQLFGPVAHALSFREAVKKKILCDYQLLVAAVTPNDIQDITFEGTNEEKIALAAIRKLFKENTVHRGITFHSTIAKASRFYRKLQAVLPNEVFTATINKTHSVTGRVDMLDEFRQADKGIITNVRVLGEGFDFTALDFIVMVDPKRSVVDLVQNIGRVMRTHEGKKFGSIVIPVFVGEGGNTADALFSVATSEYQTVYRVAGVLGALDTVLGAEIRDARAPDADRTLDELTFFNRHLVVTGGAELSAEEISALSEKVRMYAVFGSRANFVDRQEQKLKAVLAFCEKHDRKPSVLNESEKTLYQTFYNASFTLMAPHVKVIWDYIEATWGSTSKTVRNWEKRLNEIVLFGKENGYLPGGEDSISLYKTVRLIRRNNFPEGVEEQLRDLIEAVRRIPSKRERRKDKVQQKLERLAQFVREHQRTPTPKTDKELHQFVNLLHHRKVPAETKARINEVIEQNLRPEEEDSES